MCSAFDHLIKPTVLCQKGLSDISSYIHTEMIPSSLDPFRKMFKRQKHHFQTQLASKNFTEDVLSAVVS